MAFGSIESGDDNAPLAEINMVPLIDVMLVLLIIFMITAPLLTHAVKVDLPKASSTTMTQKPEHVELALNAQGQLFWNGTVIARDTLPARLQEAAQKDAQAELHIRADGTTPYEQVAQVMSAAARAGIAKIGFVTDPSHAQR